MTFAILGLGGIGILFLLVPIVVLVGLGVLVGLLLSKKPTDRAD